ncbi:MAG: ABC transporter permease [Desulfuromonadaceae bacterium]|nr:ABC transporter permease [Desulfuromonadaceae bacterium]
MIRKLRAMLIKELRQMLRDPKMRIIVFGFPLIQLLVFSFALTLDVRNIDLVLLDYDRSSLTRAVSAAFEASGYFHIEAQVETSAALRDRLDRGLVRGALVFPVGLEADVLAGRGGTVQLLADGTMSNDAGILFSYATSIVQRFNLTLSPDRPVVELVPRSLFNVNLDSRNFYVPGLIVLMIQVTSTLLTSIAIVREKEIGTIEQVLVTPIGRFEFILGKTLPFFITGYLVASLMFVLARLVFGITIRGSLPLLALVVGLNILAYLGLALLISTVSQTQQQALLTAFFIMMPCTLLSGFLFPVANMPLPVQYLTYLNPMRWGFEAITAVVIKGAGLVELQRQIGWELVHAIGFVGVAVVKFRKTV